MVTHRPAAITGRYVTIWGPMSPESERLIRHMALALRGWNMQRSPSAAVGGYAMMLKAPKPIRRNGMVTR